jgi:hypothetical protein
MLRRFIAFDLQIITKRIERESFASEMSDQVLQEVDRPLSSLIFRETQKVAQSLYLLVSQFMKWSIVLQEVFFDLLPL